MASAVRIEVILDDRGVVTGVKSIEGALAGMGTAAQSAGAKAKTGLNAAQQEATRAQRIIEQTRTATERYGMEVQELNQMLRRGAIDQETFNRAIAQSKSRLDQAAVSAQKMSSTASTAMQNTRRSTEQARDSVDLLAGQFGIVLPRELKKFIGQTSLVAPALSMAFKASVVLAFGGVLLDLVPKIKNAADEIGGLTQDMKDLRQATIDANQVFLTGFSSSKIGERLLQQTNRAIEELEAQKRAIEAKIDAPLTLKGLSGALMNGPTATVMEQTQLRKRLNELQDEIGKLVRRQQDQLAQLTTIYKAEAEEANRAEGTKKEAITRTNTAIADQQALLQRGMDAHRKASDVAAEIAARSVEDATKAATQAGMADLKAEQERLDRIVQVNGTIAGLENETAIARAQANGDAIGAIILQEQARVEATVANLEKLGADEATIARARVAINEQANIKIAQEQQRLQERMAGEFVSLWDDIAGGNIGRRILNNFKRLFAQILANWIMTTQAMGGAAGGIGARAGGGIVGALGGLLGIGGGGGGMQVPIPGTTGITSFMPGSGGGLTPLGSVGGLGGGTFGGGASSGGGGFSLGGMLSLGGGDGNVGLLGGLGVMALPMAGGALGGPAGMVGGGLASLGLMAGAGNPAALQAVSALGLPPALLAGAAGGLMGFGIGSRYGKFAGSLAGVATGLGMMGALSLMGLSFGPIGWVAAAAIGLIGGLLGGIFGGRKRRKQAEDLARQVRGEIAKITEAYKSFQMDAPSALTSLETMHGQVHQQFLKLRGEGRQVYSREVAPAFASAMREIRSLQDERDRRGATQFGPPVYHSGGYVGIGGGASWRLTRDEVQAVIKRGEFVVNAEATSKHRSTLEAINNGVPASGGGGTTINIQAWDGDSVDRWLRNGGAARISRAQDRVELEGGY